MNEGAREPLTLWLGGGTGAGKSTIASSIARRFDLALYRIDAYTYVHRDRLVERGLMMEVQGDYDDRWLTPRPDDLAVEFADASAKVLGCVLEDLQASDDQVITIVEGPQLFPSLVAPLLPDAQRGLWLIPSSSFRRRTMAARATDSAKFTSDADRALMKRLERDAIIDSQVRDEARKEGFTVFDVDGSEDLTAMIGRVTDYFRPMIDAGPRIADGAHRRRRRQAENAATARNVRAFLNDLGDDAPADPPPFRVACECDNLGCDAVVEVKPDEYERAIERGAVTESSECVGRLR